MSAAKKLFSYLRNNLLKLPCLRWAVVGGVIDGLVSSSWLTCCTRFRACKSWSRSSWLKLNTKPLIPCLWYSSRVLWAVCVLYFTRWSAKVAILKLQAPFRWILMALGWKALCLLGHIPEVIVLLSKAFKWRFTILPVFIPRICFKLTGLEPYCHRFWREEKTRGWRSWDVCMANSRYVCMSM